ncbi:hypothetical protein C8F01DRAFT_1311955 [Mycena amicta]|nr:hypothetical protein C8F01DRAFT_1311955 [Mycena amicta]
MALVLPEAIHPDLRLDKLTRLPPDIRRIAKLAANGSFENLVRLSTIKKEFPDAKKLLCLPVYYALLDPALIPDVDDDEDINDPPDEIRASLTRGFAALQSIESYKMTLPSSIYPALWPRLWTWMQALDRLCPFLGQPMPGTLWANRVHFLSTVSTFRANDTARELVEATPGVWTMVAHLWRHCVRNDLFPRRFQGCKVIDFFVGQLFRIEHPPAEHVSEMIDALGGTQTDLAHLAIQHLTVLSRPRPSHDHHILNDINTIISFLAATSRRGLILRGPFLAAGITRALSRLSVFLCEIPIASPDAANHLRVMWDIVRWAETENVLTNWIPRALKSGFIPVLWACTVRRPTPRASEEADFRQVLTRDLLAATVYRCMLRQYAKAAAELARTAPRDWHSSPFFRDWRMYEVVAEERLKLLQQIESMKYQDMRGCDNADCGTIAPRKQFRRCGRCKRHRYCSSECQIVAWTKGRHHEFCRRMTQETFEDDRLKRRDRVFLRALLHYEYMRPETRRRIWTQQVMFFLQCERERARTKGISPSHPNGRSVTEDASYFLLLDLSHGWMSSNVLPLYSPTTTNGFVSHAPTLTPSLRHLTRASHGRIELHRLRISAGSAAHEYWFPMRASDTRIVDGLREIARKVFFGELELEEAARSEMISREVMKLEEAVFGDDGELPFPGRGTEAVTRLLPTPMFSKRGIILRRDARTLLPVELWERVLYQVPSTEDLLTRLAAVCALYNELCIRICLERQGVTTEDLQKPILHLSGAITRPICLLPRVHARALPARQVNCDVDPAKMSSELRRLAQTLQRCVGLDTLSIALQSDPFQVSRLREAALSGLCELLSWVAARNNAPVFVLVGRDMFSCMPADISLWKLHQFEFNPPAPSPSGTSSDPIGARSYTWTRLHTGNSRWVHRLTSLKSVHLTLQRGLQPFSLLTLNLASITQLALGSRPEEFVPYFTSMIWHITLPNLSAVDIYTDEIDPAALRDFLVRHPLIENLHFSLPSNDDAILHPLLDAPLTHPNLVSLFARAHSEPCAHPIIHFLCESPKIRTFGFALDPFGPTSHADPFLRDLGHIASRACPEPVELNLFLGEFRHLWSSLVAYFSRKQPLTWARTTEALAIAARMHNIHKLKISLSSRRTAEQLLPWLAAFPAVTEIKFSYGFCNPEFVHAARQALPNVQHVSCDP